MLSRAAREVVRASAEAELAEVAAGEESRAHWRAWTPKAAEEGGAKLAHEAPNLFVTCSSGTKFVGVFSRFLAARPAVRCGAQHCRASKCPDVLPRSRLSSWKPTEAARHVPNAVWVKGDLDLLVVLLSLWRVPAVSPTSSHAPV